MDSGTAPAQEAPKLYAFDAAEHIIELNTRPDGAPRIVRHKLRKPTFVELEARDRKQAAETVTHGAEEFIESTGSAPDLELWGKLCTAAQGYRPKGEWIEGADLDAIPAAHKLAAIRALHQAEFEVVTDEGELDYFVIGATETKVKQTIGNYEIIHTLREMTESERLAFENKSFRASFVRGKGKETRTRIVGNLKAYVDLYDKLIVFIEGGSVDGTSWDGWRAATAANAGDFWRAIDPLFKRGVINAMLASQTAIASD